MTLNLIDPKVRFRILHRDNFTCAYCGIRPGNDHLNIDHMISRSAGGSSSFYNLITSCDKCNNGKNSLVAIPQSLCDGGRDSTGWITWKRWGRWELKWNPDGEGESAIALAIQVSGHEWWIGLDRIHEPDWDQHVEQKEWATSDVMGSFLDAITFARTLTTEPCRT